MTTAPMAILGMGGGGGAGAGGGERGAGGVILGSQTGAPYSTAPTNANAAIYIGKNGMLYAQILRSTAGSATISPYAVNDGQWHHVAVTWDGSKQTVYLDGASLLRQIGHESLLGLAGVTDFAAEVASVAGTK